MFSYLMILMPILGCTGPRSGNYWKLKPDDPCIQTCVKKYISLLFMNQLTYLLKAPPCTV